MEQLEQTNGIWIKYDREPGNNFSKEASFHRLEKDLEGTNFGRGRCWADELCGEFIPSHGINSGDIYIYYLTHGDKKIPKIYIKTTPAGKEMFFDIEGSEIVLSDKEISYEVEAGLLPILLSKLEEIFGDIKEKGFKVPIDKLKNYQKLSEDYDRLRKIKKKTEIKPEEILFLYSQANRKDTLVVRELMKNRSIQDDYNSFNLEDKKSLVKIICSITHFYSDTMTLSYFRRLTQAKEKEPVLKIAEREVLLDTASATQLQCLAYASEELLSDKNFILEVLANFQHDRFDSFFFQYIPIQFRFDLDILRLATKSCPLELVDIIKTHLSPGSQFYSDDLKQRLNDIGYAKTLLQIYLANVLANKELTHEKYIDSSILWHLPTEILEDLKNVLYGPQPTPESEAMKNYITLKLDAKKSEIKEFYRSREKKQ